MSFSEHDDERPEQEGIGPEEGDDSVEGWDEALAPRWPLDWRGLLPHERWVWFMQLWEDTCALRVRYRLPVRAEWWEDAVQVEALAALAAWVSRYDGGEWDDPPGKLTLLYELDRIAALMREGGDPFSSTRDRPAFLRHLIEIGCRPPGAG